MRTIFLFLALTASLSACAQYDTTNIRSDAPQWGWTDPPPVMNLVDAGIALQQDARRSGLGWWSMAGGFVAGTLFYISDDHDAAYAIAGMGIGAHITFNLLAIAPRRKAGMLLQQGWQPGKLYEMVPDNVGFHVPGTVKRSKR